jgi:ligand-binding sensor domain-containing protein
MKKHLKLFVLFLMIIFYSFCNAQNKTELPTGNTKSENKDVITSTGPKRVTRTIRQDRNGNIWLAAHDGIFRYDGKSFTNITSKMSSTRFFSVLEDRKGNFWFTSPDSGVYYYDGKSLQNITTQQGLVNQQVPCIYEDKTGNIWFGTPTGASRYDGKSFRNYKMNEELPGLPDNNDNVVYAIMEDKTGKFWFGTKGKAFVYDGKTFTVITHKGKPYKNVRTIIEDKKGIIWLGGDDGLWRYDGSTFINITQNSVGYIYEDKKGNIWTSLQSANGRWALFRYDEKSLSDKKPTVTEIISDDDNKGLFGFLEANDGSIWFGALDGAYRYDEKTIKDFKEGQE